MLDLELSPTSLYFLLPFLFLFIINLNSILTSLPPSKSAIPRSYPFIGSLFSIYSNRNRMFLWISDVLWSSPSSTFVLHFPLGHRQVFTANPSNVQHILSTHFSNYQKRDLFRTTLGDFFGSSLLTMDGETWKSQRKFATHEFNTKSLRKFLQTVVDTELSDRLLPILSAAAANKTLLDLQDILQRFSFDIVCSNFLGYDPMTLVSSLPQVKFVQAFDDGVRLTFRRFNSIHPVLWKTKRFLNLGSEKQIRIAINKVHGFAKKIIKEKKQDLNQRSSRESVDYLSRLLSFGHADEAFITDMIISGILAGRDTISSALIWFFWLVSRHPNVEREILKEINKKSEAPIYEEVMDMVYTHASLSESMRLYPPIGIDGKQAIEDDVLPDGTIVKKGTWVYYHAYAMGRSEKLWGIDWAEFRPERWLERDSISGKWNFLGRDAYTYPVFHAGPRICLGKEMAFLQMKRVVAGVFRKFRIVSALEDEREPELISDGTIKMKGDFPVTIEERAENF